MNNFENIINIIVENDIKIPDKVQTRINETLKNKKKTKKIYVIIKKIIITILSLLVSLVGGVVVYAMAGGTINELPATEWLGIKFSNNYIDYKKHVENQVSIYENTKVELTSTLCDEGMLILEFNVKLSDEDYKKLKIGESIITEKYLESMEKRKLELRDYVIRTLKDKKYNEELGKMSNNIVTDKDIISYEDLATDEENIITYEDIVVDEKEIQVEYDKELEKIEKAIEERKNTKFIPALCLNNNQKGGTYNYDKFNPNMDWYASIYIDDKPYYARNWENIEKVSDYEYKIYVLYSLTEEQLEGKDNFKITLKNNKLVNMQNWTQIKWRNDCQWFIRNIENELMGEENTVSIDLNIDFEATISKNEILKDSNVMENLDIESKFRNITFKVEKVVDSPIQTVVVLKHSATNQSSNAFANKYDNPNIEHLPLTREYKIYDANGKELSYFSTSNKNTLIYSNGTREDYDPHDIPNKKYSNAIWENIDYLLIEKTNTDYIKIVPIETIRNPVDGVESNSGEIYYEMDPLVINLK